jgi:hypothetical protein
MNSGSPFTGSLTVSTAFLRLSAAEQRGGVGEVARVALEGVARAGTTVSAMVIREPTAGIPTAKVKRLRMSN